MLIYIIMDSENLGHLALLAKTIAILAILSLDLTKKIRIPWYVISLFAFSGLTLGFIHRFHEEKEDPIYNYHYHNLMIGVSSILVLLKRLI